MNIAFSSRRNGLDGGSLAAGLQVNNPADKSWLARFLRNSLMLNPRLGSTGSAAGADVCEPFLQTGPYRINTTISLMMNAVKKYLRHLNRTDVKNVNDHISAIVTSLYERDAASESSFLAVRRLLEISSGYRDIVFDALMLASTLAARLPSKSVETGFSVLSQEADRAWQAVAPEDRPWLLPGLFRVRISALKILVRDSENQPELVTLALNMRLVQLTHPDFLRQ